MPLPDMKQIEYIGDVIKFTAIPIALYELLPLVRRQSIENRIESMLTYRLILRIVLLSVISYGLLLSFPYIAPYLVVIIAFTLSIVRKLVAYSPDVNGTNAGLGCIIYGSPRLANQ